MLKGSFEVHQPLLRVQAMLSEFSKAERRVADAILSDQERTIRDSVTDLAERAEVGETTVIRFCRKVGYRGYQEFKLALAQDLVDVQGKTDSVLGPVHLDDTPSLINQKLTQAISGVIHDTASLLDLGQVEKAQVLLLGAGRITAVGVGHSGVSVQDVSYRFLRLGLPVTMETDSHLMAMRLSVASPDDVIFAVSASGSTRDVVDAVTLAKGRGAKVICLTSHAHSPLARLADCILLTTVRESPFEGGSFATKIAQMYVIDLVATVVATRAPGATLASVQATAKAVVDKLY
jgi:DNA-binding MurR/RpiR family transcriptional regulator